MLNLAQLSRELDVPYTSLRRLVDREELLPDAIAGKFMLFEAARVSQVRKLAARIFGMEEFAAARPRGLIEPRKMRKHDSRAAACLLSRPR